jgi:VIT1/CCC1 family predicted Fe2+/Mn2+ transporter
VLIFVEAISMSAGSFLSESSAEEYESRTDAVSKKSYIAAIVMFVSYFVSGFIPLAPYVFFVQPFAFWASIGVSVFALLLLGIVGARIARVSMVKNAVRMVLIGGLAIGVGTLVGTLLG